MKWTMKLACLFGLLLFTCSCASLYTQKTEAELTYDGEGRPTFKLYNSKAYQGLSIDVVKGSDGTTTFSYQAEIVDSNTVAKEVAESNKVLSQTLSNVANGVIGMAVPVQ